MAKRRRRKASSFDARVIPFLALLLLIAIPFYAPQLGVTLAAMLFVVSAIAWIVGARKRLSELHRWGAVSNMYALSPEEFERHAASTYAALGYRVTVTKRIGDQGLDVIAERGNERLGIQCKRTTEPAPNSVVQEAHAGKAHYQCTSAMVIALGGFTTAAKALAASTGTVLLDGPKYADLFHRATASLPSRSIWNVAPRMRVATFAVVLALLATIMLMISVAKWNTPPRTQASNASRDPAAWA